MLSKKALGAAAAQESLFIEDVFSTWLRTGTGADVTVTNNIDMTEGYLLWTKSRSAATDHAVYDSGRGVTKDLVTNSTAAETTQSTGLKAVSGTGYTIGSLAKMNTSSATYVDWVFRKAPKFFDVVTYTGNGVAGRTVAHNLGSVPGMVIVKNLSAGDSWAVYHRSTGATNELRLNSTLAAFASSTAWNDTNPTNTVFTVGTGDRVNTSGAQYVAYLFAHDAGGFGDAGDQNVVSCGSYTGNGSANGPTISLGYEPQYLMIKSATTAFGWRVVDNMRGMSLTNTAILEPNNSGEEGSLLVVAPNATGFQVITTNAAFNTSGATYIYLAIRRGPMKTPTVGTSVFAPVAGNGSATIPAYVTNFPVDAGITSIGRTGSTYKLFTSRLTGATGAYTSGTDVYFVENDVVYDSNVGYMKGGWGTVNGFSWAFRRAPGFFDVVCYTGTGVARTVNHNLGVAPELMIVKGRSTSYGWQVYLSSLGATSGMELNGTFPAGFSSAWSSTSPTSSQFTVSADFAVNQSGATYVAYLYATVPNVSKVGSYTGTGGTQTINAGLPTGARFVLIKRTDSTGSWWVWDTSRGMVAGTDPRLALNTTAAEVNNNWVYTIANGFQIVTTDATINASGGSYIYLAIA